LVKRIGNHAGERPSNGCRYERDATDERHGNRVLRNRVDLQTDGDDGQLNSKTGEKSTQPQAGKRR
jgi:hypothetical protein